VYAAGSGFSNFGSLKIRWLGVLRSGACGALGFSNFGSLKIRWLSGEHAECRASPGFQQFRLVEDPLARASSPLLSLIRASFSNFGSLKIRWLVSASPATASNLFSAISAR